MIERKRNKSVIKEQVQRVKYKKGKRNNLKAAITAHAISIYQFRNILELIWKWRRFTYQEIFKSSTGCKQKRKKEKYKKRNVTKHLPETISMLS